MLIADIKIIPGWYTVLDRFEYAITVTNLKIIAQKSLLKKQSEKTAINKMKSMIKILC